MGIGLHLDDGPDDKQSITEAYQGKILPPQLSAVGGHKYLCAKTGKWLRQEDDAQIFLVPVRAGGVDDLIRRHV